MGSQATTLNDQAASATEEKATGGFEDLISQGINGGEASGEEHSAGPAETETTGEETAEAKGEESREQEAGAEDAGQETADEQSLLPTEEEADFSDAVYTRFAAHYKKRGVEFDITNPKDRLALHEIISRGQAIERLKTAQEKPEAAAEDAEAQAGKEEKADANAGKRTPEEYQQLLGELDRYVDTRIVPEVAMSFASDFVNALWPEQVKKGEIKVTPEMAKGLTKVFTKFGHMLLDSELGQYADHHFQKSMGQHFPMISRVHDTAIDEQAIENLEGKADFSDLSELINSGAVAKTFQANPWIRQNSYADAKGKRLDPIAQRERQLTIAVQLARGQRVNPALLTKAVETGKKKEQERANAARAGKLAGGESKGGFQQGAKPGDDVRSQVLDGGESKFSKAIEESRIREKTAEADVLRKLRQR